MNCPLLLLGLMALLNPAASRSVRQVGGGYSPVLPGGYYAQPPPPHYPVYPPHSYGYGGYQAHPPPHGFGPAGNYYGVFQSFPGGGDPVQFDYNNRCSRNYIGIKPHPDQNQYYYVCQSNCVIFSKCRNHQSFDPTTGRCVQQLQRGPQQAPQPHRPRPSCQKEGRFPHPDDCKVYYRCDKNQTQPWLFACPEGTIFSPLVRKCVPGDQCPSTEISGSGSYIPQNCELKFPVCTEEGTFRSPTDCALYYTCRQQENGNYLQTRFKCPGSNSFDTERKLCRPRSEVDCYDYPPPLPYYPYYPPYPAAPLYEEDDYDTGAGAANKEPAPETALKSGKFQENIVILPTTTTTEKPHYGYPSYSYYGSQEPAAESLHANEEKIVKPSVNVVILPSSTPATTSTQYQSTKYQYKRFTETPQAKESVQGLHIANNIVILPTTTETTTTTTTTTTTAKPTAHTCPTIPTTTSTQKPTTIPNTSTVPTSTLKPKTTTQETSTVTSTTKEPTKTTVTTTTKKLTTITTPVPTTTTQKPTTTTAKTTTREPSTPKPTRTTEKTSTSSKTTEKTTTTTKKPKTTTQTLETTKITTTTQKPTTTTTPKPSSVTTTTSKPTETTPRSTTVTTTTQKPTETSPKSTTVKTTTQKSTETTPKSTTVTTTTPKPATTTSKPTTETTTTQKPTTTTPTPTTTTSKPSTVTTITPKPTKTTPESTTVTTTTQKSTETTPKTSTVTTTTPKPTTTTPKPPSTTPETTTVTTTTQRPTTTTPKPTTTTPKPTTTTPTPTTETTTTQKPTTTTPKTSTVTSTTPEPKTTTQKTTTVTTTTLPPSTTTPKTSTVTTTTLPPSTTTPKTSTVTTTTPKLKTTTPSPTTTTKNPTTVTSSTQKPTSTTPWLTTETTTVLITTERPTTTTPRTSTVTISTQGPTTTEKSTSVTATSTVTTSPAPEHNSTATTDLTTRPHCPDPESTSDTNTQPACTPTQHLQSLLAKEPQSSAQSPNQTHSDTAIMGSGKREELQQPLRANSLNSREESLDYMDDGPSFPAESKAEAGKATTAKVPTMSTLAAAHILRKLFHVISTTTPPSQERATSQRQPGVTIAQMARHNLATSKPFIAHSLRLSIQQLASTQKREIQSQNPPPVAVKKESEDSEYYDTSEQQYGDEEDNQVVERREKPRAMASSTTMAAVLPPVQESTTTTEKHETSSQASTTRRQMMSTSTPQPLEMTTTMSDSEYSDSDYANDEAENEIPGGVKSLEARKSMLLSLLRERLQPLPVAMAARKMESSSSASPSTSTTFRTSFSTSSSTSSPLTSTTTKLPSKPKSTLPAGSKGHRSSEYYDDDDDYMEDEPASGLANQSRDTLAKKPLAVTAKRHIVVLPQSQLQPQPQIQKVASVPIPVSQKVTSPANLQGLSGESPQLPTASFLRQSSAEADGGKRQSQSNSLADEASRRLSFLGRILRLTSRATTVKPQTTSTHITKSTRIPKTLSTASFTASTTESSTTTATETSSTTTASTVTRGEATRVPRSFMTKLLENAGKAHALRVAKLRTGTPTKLPPPSVRQEVLSVNSRPWLLAARNQTVHITPITVNSTLNPVSQFNSLNILRPSLVSHPEDYSTEKVPQLIVKVYEPIDLKIVFCPKTCDQDHDHKYDPADNHKNITSCTGGNCEEEEIHKHVDIQWKPLELGDIASFRNAA